MKHAKLSILAVILLISTLLISGYTEKRHVKAVRKSTVIHSAQTIADWQIKNFSYSTDKNLHDYGIDSWTNATFFIGLSEWIKTTGKNGNYSNWLREIGKSTNYELAENFKNNNRYLLYHADELAIGQFFLNQYDLYKDSTMYKSTLDRVEWIMNNPPQTPLDAKSKQWWSWCDALFMAPPVYLHLSLIKDDNKYVEYMDAEFKRTYNYLYDKENLLFFRDGSYFDKRELNGNKIFWGRGNGWVAAGLVQILKLLPLESPYRLFYEDLFREFVPRLAGLQNKDGFWHASLLDQDSYPAPEVSATALITYAIAYGINTGILPKEKYMPITLNSWKALNSAIDSNGKLGWVQPIGADPKKVTAEMTAVYGVGAFLLAGSEIYKLETTKQ